MTDSTISYDDYLRLQGLLTLADDLRNQQSAILNSVGNIVGEKPNDYGYRGHSDDAIYSGYSAKELLSKLGIGIEEE